MSAKNYWNRTTGECIRVENTPTSYMVRDDKGEWCLNGEDDKRYAMWGSTRYFDGEQFIKLEGE